MRITSLVAFLLLAVPYLSGTTQTSVPAQPITPENVAELAQVGMFGRGTPGVIVWSPDGNLLAIGSTIGVWIYDAHHLDHAPILLGEGMEEVMFLSFSPDSTRLAAIGCTARSYETDGSTCHRTLTQLYELPSGTVLAEQIVRNKGYPAALATDGMKVYTAHQTGTIHSLGIDGSSELLFEWNLWFLGASFDLIHGRIAFTDDESLQVWNLESLEREHRFPDRRGYYGNEFTFSPSGELLLHQYGYGSNGVIYKGGSWETLWSFESEARGSEQRVLYFDDNRLLMRVEDAYHWLDPATGESLEGSTETFSSLQFETPILIAASSPDGSILAYIDEKRVLQYRDLQTGSTTTLHRPEGEIYTLYFDNTGSTLTTVTLPELPFSARADEYVWDVATGEQIEYQSGTEIDLRSTPSDEQEGEFIVHYNYSSITLSEGDSGRTAANLLMTGIVYDTALSPDGRLFAVAGCDFPDWYGCMDGPGLLTFWNTETWTEIGRLYASVYELNSIDFSPDGTVLSAGGRDGIVRLWQIANGNDLFCALCEPRSTLLEEIERRTIANASDQLPVTLEVQGSEYNIDLSPDGSQLAVATANGVLLYAVRDLTAEPRLLMSEIPVWRLTFSMDGTRLVAIHSRNISTDASRQPSIHLWDTTTGEALPTFAVCEGDQDIYATITAAAISPDNAQLGVLCEANIQLFDIPSGRLIRTLDPAGYSSDLYGELAFNGDGTLLMADSSQAYSSKATSIWDVETGERLGNLYASDVGAFRADGTIITSAQIFGTMVFDLIANQILLRLPSEDIYDTSLNQDGTILIAHRRRGDVIFYDLSQRNVIQTIPVSSESLNFYLSADATVAAHRQWINSSERLIQIWDVVSGSIIGSIHFQSPD